VQALAVDGVRLAYEERGSGDPLVLVHGTGAQIEVWGQTLDDLAASHRVIAYDRRGYGRSEHRPVRDYRRHVADAVELIERLVGGPAVVVGHSSGASVALVLATERPDLVRALVVAEPSFHGGRYATGSLLGMIARVKLKQLADPKDAAAIFYRWDTSYQTGGNAFDRLPVELRELLLGNARPLLVELDPHPTAAFEYLPTRRLRAIAAPITFVLGDLTEPWFHRIHAKLVSKVPGIRTERIPGAGHALFLDAPAEFAAAVERGAARASLSEAPRSE